MSNVAILIGNTEYKNLQRLDCCAADVAAMKDLLEATQKYAHVEAITDVDSTLMKDRIRAVADLHPAVDELFFYFTGHGYLHQSEFYYCATNFNSSHPNETGLSMEELHTLLKLIQSKVVVKVIDACNSGMQLIKSQNAFVPVAKYGFQNLIQIASCLDTQQALTGDPISAFTAKFRSAALRKNEGALYYTDIIASLRDEYIENDTQTPHFVAQGSGRETFVDDAKLLDGLRARLEATREEEREAVTALVLAAPPLTLLEVLKKTENKFANQETAETFVSGLFGKITARMTSGEFFSDLFDAKASEHGDYSEPTARSFIIRVLSNEKRPDNFVTAESRQVRKPDLFGLATAMSTFARQFQTDDEAVTHYTLRLNCRMEKVQLRITLVPKFAALKQFILVVSCGPSLETCYVMEMLTQHRLRDWGVFDTEGVELVRRWYQMSWTDSVDGLVTKICDKVKELVHENIAATASASGLIEAPPKA